MIWCVMSTCLKSCLIGGFILIWLQSFSLNFLGMVLVEDTTIELNYGRRYGLIGRNGCGKSTFLQCLAAREVPIPEHIDVYLLR